MAGISLYQVVSFSKTPQKQPIAMNIENPPNRKKRI
jgi:hypothetical protein